jgi:hypothetical protein
MIRSSARKFVRVGRITVSLVGLAVVLALLVMVGDGFAPQPAGVSIP